MKIKLGTIPGHFINLNVDKKIITLENLIDNCLEVLLTFKKKGYDIRSINKINYKMVNISKRIKDGDAYFTTQTIL